MKTWCSSWPFAEVSCDRWCARTVVSSSSVVFRQRPAQDVIQVRRPDLFDESIGHHLSCVFHGTRIPMMCCTSRRICTFIAARLSSVGDDTCLRWGSDTDLQSDRTLSLRMVVSSSHFRSSKWESWSSDQWTRCTSNTSVTSHLIMDSTTNVDRSRRLNRYDLQDGTQTETWPIS